ncbi:MAG: hypothetical protein EI684_20990, partial [Candidatus Viridilinea halotolerans]
MSPSFTTFALRLVAALRAWQDPLHGPALAYFAGDLRRHGGDELRLRAALVRDHLLQQGFGYPAETLELEAADRVDLLLYAPGPERRPVALIETKRSGFGDLLTTRQASGETPPEQLARYARLRGLYLGALTNGVQWYFFDLATSLQPCAALNLLDLALLLEGITSEEGAAAALAGRPDLANALVVAQALLGAEKWQAVAHYQQELRDAAQFHAQPLVHEAQRTGLLNQIRERLALLRDTILALFVLLERDLATFEALAAHVSASDPRPYAPLLAAQIDLVTQAVPDVAQRTALRTALHEICLEFAQQGDTDWFYSAYALRAIVLQIKNPTKPPGRRRP